MRRGEQYHHGTLPDSDMLSCADLVSAQKTCRFIYVLKVPVDNMYSCTHK